MIERQPSRTALATAALRAAHQVFDAPPRILEDPVALALLGTSAEADLRRNDTHYQSPRARALRAQLVLRARYAEDRLAAAIVRGVRRLVILGAGFDTFAYRQPAWARPLRILEVDHAATQAAKRERLAAAGVLPPANLAYAQIDFERESLAEGLARQGVTPAEPVFFTWLGVSMYLKDEAVNAVWRTVAGFPAGSEIVFDFAPAPTGDAEQDAGIDALARLAAQAGEPWLSSYEPRALAHRLRALGFAAVEFLTPDEAGMRYLKDCPADLPTPRRTTIASARR